jgi:hypothetical protein
MSIFYSKNGKVTYKTLDFLGYPMYCVGDNGSVWSCWTGRGHCARIGNKWKKMQLTRRRGGTDYWIITFKQAGRKPATFYVHNLVLLAFIGPRPSGYEACHGELGSLVNDLHNLRWGTHLENVRETHARGLEARGEHHGQSKITDEGALEIRQLYASGKYSQGELGELYGLSQGSIHHLLAGNTWSHVGGPCIKGLPRRVLKGEQSGKSTLTVEKVLKIRRLWDEGWNMSQIAADVGNVSVSGVSHVIHRRVWKHV